MNQTIMLYFIIAIDYKIIWINVLYRNVRSLELFCIRFIYLL